MNAQQLKRDFLKLIKETAPEKHTYDVFRDFCEIAALTIHQLPYHADLRKNQDFDSVETRYLEEIKRYKPDDVRRIAEMFNLAVTSLSSAPSDFLGNAFQELEFSNKDTGQFFTPFHLCQMAAQMTAGDLHEQLKDRPYITVSDPASGGGAQLIAFAVEATRQGIDPRSCILFDAIDVDRRCFNMTYFQLSAIGLRANVHWGNTISLEMFEHRQTMQEKYFQQWARSARLIAGLRELMQHQQPDEEVAAPTQQEPETHPAPVKMPDILLKPVQLSLFEADGKIA